MANENRRRNDCVAGVLGSTLSAASTTMTSAGLASLEAISSTEHAVIVIDPGRTAGAPETVWVSAHTASSTSAKVIRGREGTSARTHSSTERWVHAPTSYDFPLVRTSTSRPSADVYEGQIVYEDDTNELVVYNGAAWAPVSAGGQLGYASASTAQTLTGAADLTGLSVTFTGIANRRHKITANVAFDNDNASANRVQLRLYTVISGTTTLRQTAFGALAASGANNESGSVALQIVRDSTAGSVTYKLNCTATLFNVKTVTSGGPATLLVEDLGPS